MIAYDVYRITMTEMSISCMKCITQNMRYLQSLMSYAQRYGVSQLVGSTTEPGHSFTSRESGGTGVWNHCNSNPDNLTPIPIITRKKD